MMRKDEQVLYNEWSNIVEKLWDIQHEMRNTTNNTSELEALELEYYDKLRAIKAELHRLENEK